MKLKYTGAEIKVRLYLCAGEGQMRLRSRIGKLEYYLLCIVSLLRLNKATIKRHRIYWKSKSMKLFTQLLKNIVL